MKQILIMRHGEPLHTPGMDNFDLPLSDDGRKTAALKGVIMSRKGVLPDVILSSPALRAKTTAELAADSFGYKGEILFDRRFYTDDGDFVVDTIMTLPENINRVLIVGHNPMLMDLVYALTSPPKFIQMNPATLVALTLKECEWIGLGPGKCRFEWAV